MLNTSHNNISFYFRCVLTVHELIAYVQHMKKNVSSAFIRFNATLFFAFAVVSVAPLVFLAALMFVAELLLAL